MEVIFEHKELNEVKEQAMWISLGEDHFQEIIANTRDGTILGMLQKQQGDQCGWRRMSERGT